MKEHVRPDAATSIRVSIVEDDRLTREALAQLIRGTPGYSCVGTFGSLEEAVAIAANPTDVFLVDIDLPGMSGSDGVRVLQEKHPAAQIVMLTVYADEDKIFDSIRNGACGYLLKETPPAKLLEAITDACNGGAPMSREVARKVVTVFQQGDFKQKLNAQMSPQEVWLLQLLAQGFSYQGASNKMNVSINTIRNYIRSIYDKLHVHTKSEAVSKAIHNRLIS
jgi:DNA-binding NarL/FixJ family response regulator